MLLKLDEYCKEKGYENCIGTVHPDNIYSINNITKDDFKIVNIKILCFDGFFPFFQIAKLCIKSLLAKFSGGLP